MSQGGGHTDPVHRTVPTDRWFAAAAGIIVGLVYLLTMARTVSFWDSGEYIACSWIAGIPHPPCVPLFVLLGRFSTLLFGFIPDIATRTNLMCVIAGAVSMALLARLTQRWSVRMGLPPSLYRPVSVAAALLAGFSFTVWQNNNAMETYAISECIAVTAIWVFDIWIVRTEELRPADRQLYLVLYLLTMAVGVHLAALIAVPGIAVIYALSAAKGRSTLWRSPRFLATALGLMVLAFSVHLYMPLRAVQRPEINETDPSDWPAFRSALAREQYGQVSVFDRKGPVPEQIAQYFRYLSWQSGLPQSWDRMLGAAGTPLFFAIRFAITISALWGCVLLWRRNRRILLYVGTIFLMASAFFIFYLNFKTGPIASSTGEVRERDYFYADSFALFAVFAAFGAGAFLRTATRRDEAAWAVMLLPVASLAGNYFMCDRSRDVVARDYGINLLESCSEGAVLITNGDNDTFPLWFAQSVLGVRRDVIVSNLSLMNTDWYLYQLLDRDPALIPFGDLGLVDSMRPVFIWGPHFFHVTQDGMPLLSETDSGILRSVFPQAWPWAIRRGDFALALPGESYGVQGSIGMQDLVMLSMVARRDIHGRDIYLAGTVAEDSRIYVEPYLIMEGIAFRVGDEPGTGMVDVGRSWSLMDSYRFEGLDDPGIFKDDQAVLLARNYVLAYHRLVDAHYDGGSADSAGIALARAESLFVAMPSEWMQFLPTHALLAARLVDGIQGCDSAASYILSAADRLAGFASARSDSRLSQTAVLLGQVAMDYDRESQLERVVDSLQPGTAANVWLQVEVDLHFGNHIGAWNELRGFEETHPGDPTIAFLRSEMDSYLETTDRMDRFDLQNSAVSTIVQAGDTARVGDALDAMISFLAAGEAGSAYACGAYYSAALEEPGAGSLLSGFAASIADDPAVAEARAEWFTLESVRTSPGILAWECARLGEHALCYAALARTDATEETLGRMLADPAAYARGMSAPAL